MENPTDNQVESEAVDYFLDENLTPEDQSYLMGLIERDPNLEVILDILVTRAIEVTSEGPVVDNVGQADGSGTDDTVAARLSEGEFVFTAKAVETIGIKTLEELMAAAESGKAIDKLLNGIDLNLIKLSRQVEVEGKEYSVKETAKERKDDLDNRIAKLEQMASNGS
jgi:hypothetical protein